MNIGAAAMPRAAAIFTWLRRRAADVVVLTETSAGAGTGLLVDELRSIGYVTYAIPSVGDRGVVLATRLAVSETLDPLLPVTLPWRIAGVMLDTVPAVGIVGVYVPSRDRSETKVRRKREFIDSLLGSLRGLPTEVSDRLMLIGDYNAIARRHRPPRAGFLSYEYALHDELERFGFVAAHELRPAPAQPHSWIGRTGNGYLYDYVHVGHRLHRRIERCSYLHAPRTRRLSDHAAVEVRWR